MLKGKVQVSSSFVLLMAVLFYLDEGVGLLFSGLLACVFHELGHILTIYILGGRVERLALTATGAELVMDARFPLSYLREAIAALMGPLTSFLCAWVAACANCYLAAGLNLTAGIFNLLPIWPLDGGRVLYALFSMRWDAVKMEKTMTVFSAGLVGVLFGIGLILLRWWGNPTLAVTSGLLLTGVLKKSFFQRKNEKSACK